MKSTRRITEWRARTTVHIVFGSCIHERASLIPQQREIITTIRLAFPELCIVYRQQTVFDACHVSVVQQ